MPETRRISAVTDVTGTRTIKEAVGCMMTMILLPLKCVVLVMVKILAGILRDKQLIVMGMAVIGMTKIQIVAASLMMKILSPLKCVVHVLVRK